jgi:hypothetical protein
MMMIMMVMMMMMIIIIIIITIVCEFLSFFQNSRCLLNICFDFTGPQFLFNICLPSEYHSKFNSSLLKAYVLLNFNVACMLFLAGLVELLYNRFRATIVISTTYLIITITLHSWSLSERWEHPLEHIWPDGLIWLYVIQRLCE